MTILFVAVTSIGIVLILAGAGISLYKWTQEQKPAPGEVETEATGAGDVLYGMAKLAAALNDHPLGLQLMLIGVVLVVFGGSFSSAQCL